MRIESVSVQVLETPVSLEYTAAGNDVSSNWHVLARLRTDDGIEGIGWVVANRGRSGACHGFRCRRTRRPVGWIERPG